MTDAEITVDGHPIRLRMTLSALAQIEESLGASTLPELMTRLANPSAGQLLVLLRTLARAATASAESRR